MPTKLPRYRDSGLRPKCSDADLIEKVLHDTKTMDTFGFTSDELKEHEKLVKDTEKLLADMRARENKV